MSDIDKLADEAWNAWEPKAVLERLDRTRHGAGPAAARGAD